MGGEELERLSAKKISLGELRKTASGHGHFVPVNYDGGDQLSLYLPVLWAPQGVKKWDGKDGQPDKYELQVVVEDAQRRQLELIDRRLKDLTVDRHAEFWKGLERAGAAYKYNSLIDVPAERPDLKPSITLKMPMFGGKFVSHYEDGSGAKMALTTDNYGTYIKRGSRIRASVNVTLFVQPTGAYPVFSIHAAVVLPPQGRPVTEEQLSVLRAGAIVDDDAANGGSEQADQDDIIIPSTVPVDVPAAQEELPQPPASPKRVRDESPPPPPPKKRARAH